MTGLVVLFIAGIVIIGASGSKAGRWAGATTSIVSAVGIVGLTVAQAMGWTA